MTSYTTLEKYDHAMRTYGASNVVAAVCIEYGGMRSSLAVGSADPLDVLAELYRRHNVTPTKKDPMRGRAHTPFGYSRVQARFVGVTR